MKPRLLLLDPSAERAAPVLGAAAEAGWEGSVAEDLHDAVEALAKNPPAAVLFHLGEGSHDGLRILEALAGTRSGGGTEALVSVPEEMLEDVRPFASAMGAAALIPMRHGRLDLSDLREALDHIRSHAGRAEAAPEPARVATAAVRLAELRGETATLARRLDALRSASEMAARQVSKEDLAPRLLDWAVTLTGSRYGWVTLRSLAVSGDLLTITRPPTLDQEALNLALSLIQEPMVLDAKDHREEASLWASMGFSRVLVCPIVGGTSGWIGVADAEDPYGPEESAFMESLASLLTLQSRNSLALQQAKAATEESKALFKAATLILPYEEPEVVARQVAQTVASVLGYPHCVVLLPDSAGSCLHLSGASGALERIQATLPLDGLGLTVQAFRTGRMVYCPNTTQSPTYVSGWAQCRAELAIPLIHRNEILGVFDLQSDREQAFQGKDLRVLEAFAQRVAMLLYAARQYQSLSATKERYQGLCEGAPMGLFTWSMNTQRIEQASAVLKSWAGEDVEGRLAESIFTPSSRGAWSTWAARAEREHQPLSAHVQIGGSEEIPPIDCLLTAYPGRGRLQIPGHGVLLARAEESPHPAPQVAEPTPSSLTRILLAEPDPVWASVTRLMLEEWGYPVEVRSDLSEVPALIEGPPAECPGLIISDHALIESEGGNPARRWASSVPARPLLVLGGSGKEGLPPGRVRHITKPYRMRELREALTRVLES